MTDPLWEELSLLRSTLLPEEFAWRGSPDEQKVWESDYDAFQNGRTPSSSQVHVSLCVNQVLGIWLHVKLDVTQETPTMTVMVQRSDIISQEKLSMMAQDRLQQLASQGSSSSSLHADLPFRTFDVLTLLQEYASSIQEEKKDQILSHPVIETTSDRDAFTPSMLMHRVLFWSHHLVSPTKRKQFAAWCPELQVWGLYKLGYPGFLVFEGAKDDVTEIAKRVKVRLDSLIGRTCNGMPFLCVLSRSGSSNAPRKKRCQRTRQLCELVLLPKGALFQVHCAQTPKRSKRWVPLSHGMHYLPNMQAA